MTDTELLSDGDKSFHYSLFYYLIVIHENNYKYNIDIFLKNSILFDYLIIIFIYIYILKSMANNIKYSNDGILNVKLGNIVDTNDTTHNAYISVYNGGTNVLLKTYSTTVKNAVTGSQIQALYDTNNSGTGTSWQTNGFTSIKTEAYCMLPNKTNTVTTYTELRKPVQDIKLRVNTSGLGELDDSCYANGKIFDINIDTEPQIQYAYDTFTISYTGPVSLDPFTATDWRTATKFMTFRKTDQTGNFNLTYTISAGGKEVTGNISFNIIPKISAKDSIVIGHTTIENITENYFTAYIKEPACHVGTIYYTIDNTIPTTSTPTNKKLDYGNRSPLSCPVSVTAPGTYTVKWLYCVTFNTGKYADCTGSFTLKVTAKLDQDAPIAQGKSTTYPTTATATASGGGAHGTLQWSNGSTLSAVGSKSTKARWSGDDNYNPSPYSNEVTLTVSKGSSSITFADSANIIVGSAESKTITLTPTNCSISSVTVDASNIASYQRDGNTLTVYGVSEGSTNINVKGTGYENYNNPQTLSIPVIVTSSYYSYSYFA